MDSKYIISIPQESWNVADPRGVGVLMQETMKKYEDSPGLVDAETGMILTYSEILLNSIRVAQHILAEGITSDDIIVISAYNTINANYPFYACVLLGIRVATVDPTFSLSDFEHLFDLTKPRMVFCENETLPIIDTVIKNSNIKFKIVTFGEDDKKLHIPFSKFLKETGNEKFFQAKKPKSLRDTVVILFSSGTTGLSKGICMHHYGLIVQQNNLKRNHDISICISYTTLYWISSVMLFFMTTLNGKTRIMCRKFDSNKFMKIVEDYKVTYCLMAPILTYEITKNPLVKSYNTSTLKALLVVGSYFGKDQHELIKKCLPNTDILLTYGMTEMHGLITLFDPVKCRNILDKGNKLESCGKVTPGISLKIVEVDSEEILGPNKSGEIRLKADCLTDKYHNNPEATKNMKDSDGFFQTGDVGYYDDDQCLYVIDRIKEMLKYQSWHILPAELEAILLTHPEVNEAAVIGIPHEIDGDHPMAFIVLKSGSHATEQEILKYFNEKISDNRKHLRGGVQFVENIPKTPSGKLRKKDLRKMLKIH